jgi:hypothetical protein
VPSSVRKVSHRWRFSLQDSGRRWRGKTISMSAAASSDGVLIAARRAQDRLSTVAVAELSGAA